MDHYDEKLKAYINYDEKYKAKMTSADNLAANSKFVNVHKKNCLNKIFSSFENNLDIFFNSPFISYF
jgi:hypothetical protein